MTLRIVLLMAAALLTAEAQAKRCLLVMSYHAGYAWNDGVQRGVESVIQDKCALDVFYMDTKRHKSEEHARSVALKAKQLIEASRPDVVIASDDNASRYLVKPYYMNAELPIVFCAVNWSVSKYGYPYKNVTGMIEVAPIQPLFEVIKKVSRQVRRMVYIGADTFTERKNGKRFVDIYSPQGVAVDIVLSKNFMQWQQAYIDAQQADAIILGSNAGIEHWDDDQAVAHVRRHSRKIVVTNHHWMAPFASFAMTKVPEEQGEWAAEAALAILNGLSPAKIPIRTNRKWRIYKNTPLLTRIGVDLSAFRFKNLIEVGGRGHLTQH